MQIPLVMRGNAYYATKLNKKFYLTKFIGGFYKM